MLRLRGSGNFDHKNRRERKFPRKDTLFLETLALDDQLRVINIRIADVRELSNYPSARADVVVILWTLLEPVNLQLVKLSR